MRRALVVAVAALCKVGEAVGFYVVMGVFVAVVTSVLVGIACVLAWLAERLFGMINEAFGLLLGLGTMLILLVLAGSATVCERYGSFAGWWRSNVARAERWVGRVWREG